MNQKKVNTNLNKNKIVKHAKALHYKTKEHMKNHYIAAALGQRENTLVSGNAGDEKNLHSVGSKFIYF